VQDGEAAHTLGTVGENAIAILDPRVRQQPTTDHKYPYTHDGTTGIRPSNKVFEGHCPHEAGCSEQPVLGGALDCEGESLQSALGFHRVGQSVAADARLEQPTYWSGADQPPCPEQGRLGQTEVGQLARWKQSELG
jgi:hypothetical protein